ncbi:MAG: ABC transporter substrate-binding protein, partial [Devosia sp.]
MALLKRGLTRRRLLQTGMAGIIGTGVMPMIFTKGAWAQEFCNNPTGDTVTFGLNLPLTGAYAEEGADEQKAYELAVKHLNGEGDGGLLNLLAPSALKGNGILGKKVAFVTSDSQTKADVARAGATRMVERDGAIMITGGSSSAEAIAVQGLCQEMGVIFMAGLTHSNDTTGKDKKRYGFRH